MALFSSGISMGTEVGLKLLLHPSFSTPVARTACTVVGLGLPVYSTYKAVEAKKEEEKDQWLVYWSVYGCVSVVESFCDKLLAWVPYYYHAKLGLLVWLQFQNHQGASFLYGEYLKPFLAKHETNVDRFLNLSKRELGRVWEANRGMVLESARLGQNLLHEVFGFERPASGEPLSGGSSQPQRPITEGAAPTQGLPSSLLPRIAQTLEGLPSDFPAEAASAVSSIQHMSSSMSSSFLGVDARDNAGFQTGVQPRVQHPSPTQVGPSPSSSSLSLNGGAEGGEDGESMSPHGWVNVPPGGIGGVAVGAGVRRRPGPSAGQSDGTRWDGGSARS
eukprot:TRINITY_DN4888_c0_g1_i1.p1 TRINITY_DN4888_c0_g1~~TRINITY_DN4888_c0_g1_i1.p1  ORF type:complete len:332 (-),score=56.28 TRINITY_DN4888_c0_g1_i1:811-1806(-)